jgi:hypothetical protein
MTRVPLPINRSHLRPPYDMIEVEASSFHSSPTLIIHQLPLFHAVLDT